MRTLADIFPSFELISSVDPEEVGAAVLDLWKEAERGLGHNRTIDHFINPLFERSGDPLYPRNVEDQVVVIIAEAWNWLWSAGLIIPAPEQSANWFRRTRRGEKLEPHTDVGAFGKAAILPRALLHPIIDEKAWSLFLRGDYDVAVLQAFKSVEVAVRKACSFPDEKIGPALMREAFHPEKGPLTDKSVVVAEREATAALFAGAIGHAKNPQSHRDKAMGLEETARLLIFASYLMSVVDWH